MQRLVNVVFFLLLFWWTRITYAGLASFFVFVCLDRALRRPNKSSYGVRLPPFRLRTPKRARKLIELRLSTYLDLSVKVKEILEMPKLGKSIGALYIDIEEGAPDSASTPSTDKVRRFLTLLPHLYALELGSGVYETTRLLLSPDFARAGRLRKLRSLILRAPSTASSPFSPSFLRPLASFPSLCALYLEVNLPPRALTNMNFRIPPPFLPSIQLLAVKGAFQHAAYPTLLALACPNLVHLALAPQDGLDLTPRSQGDLLSYVERQLRLHGGQSIESVTFGSGCEKGKYTRYTKLVGVQPECECCGSKETVFFAEEQMATLFPEGW
ncbi:hypothetical protein JCM1840_000636 [Sporobolomyces johnsonii]